MMTMVSALRTAVFFILGAACVFEIEARAQDTPGNTVSKTQPGTFTMGDIHDLPIGVAMQKDAPYLPVAADNPDKKVVDAELDALRSGYDKSERVGATVYDARQVDAPTAKIVFPGYRFFLVAWDEFNKDPAHPVIGLGLGIHYFLALDPNGGKKKIFQGQGGDLLMDAHVVIRSQKDAELAWKALCEVESRAVEGKCAQVSPTEWKLGVSVWEDHRGEPLYRTTSWVNVKTDADGVCISRSLGRTELIANADPDTQHEETIRAPTSYIIPRDFREYKQLVATDKKDVKIKVGANMLTMTKSRLFIYPDGEQRPEKPFKEIVSKYMDFSPQDLGVALKSSGFNAPGKRYVLEVENVVFETDAPPQNDPWDYMDRKYREIWKQSLKVLAPEK